MQDPVPPTRLVLEDARILDVFYPKSLSWFLAPFPLAKIQVWTGLAEPSQLVVSVRHLKVAIPLLIRFRMVVEKVPNPRPGDAPWTVVEHQVIGAVEPSPKPKAQVKWISKVTNLVCALWSNRNRDKFAAQLSFLIQKRFQDSKHSSMNLLQWFQKQEETIQDELDAKQGSKKRTVVVADRKKKKRNHRHASNELKEDEDEDREDTSSDPGEGQNKEKEDEEVDPAKRKKKIKGLKKKRAMIQQLLRSDALGPYWTAMNTPVLFQYLPYRQLARASLILQTLLWNQIQTRPYDLFFVHNRVQEMPRLESEPEIQGAPPPPPPVQASWWNAERFQQVSKEVLQADAWREKQSQSQRKGKRRRRKEGKQDLGSMDGEEGGPTRMELEQEALNPDEAEEVDEEEEDVDQQDTKDGVDPPPKHLKPRREPGETSVESDEETLQRLRDQYQICLQTETIEQLCETDENRIRLLATDMKLNTAQFCRIWLFQLLREYMTNKKISCLVRSQDSWLGPILKTNEGMQCQKKWSKWFKMIFMRKPPLEQKKQDASNNKAEVKSTSQEHKTVRATQERKQGPSRDHKVSARTHASPERKQDPSSPDHKESIPSPEREPDPTPQEDQPDPPEEGSETEQTEAHSPDRKSSSFPPPVKASEQKQVRLPIFADPVFQDQMMEQFQSEGLFHIEIVEQTQEKRAMFTSVYKTISNGFHTFRQYLERAKIIWPDAIGLVDPLHISSSLSSSGSTRLFFDDQQNKENSAQTLELHPGQRAPLEDLLTTPAVLVTGMPGTGKSTLARCVRGSGHILGTRRLRNGQTIQVKGDIRVLGTVLVLEPTNALCSHMRTILRETSISTPHFLAEQLFHAIRQPTFVNPLRHVRCLILDEINMWSERLFYEVMTLLTRWMPHMPRILIFGDPGQLSAVESGSIVQQLLKWSHSDVASGLLVHRHLEHVFRAGEGTGLAAGWLKLRTARSPADFHKYIKPHSWIDEQPQSMIPPGLFVTSLDEHALWKWITDVYSVPGNKSQMTCYTNAFRLKANRNIQIRLWKRWQASRGGGGINPPPSQWIHPPALTSASGEESNPWICFPGNRLRCRKQTALHDVLQDKVVSIDHNARFLILHVQDLDQAQHEPLVRVIHMQAVGESEAQRRKHTHEFVLRDLKRVMDSGVCVTTHSLEGLEASYIVGVVEKCAFHELVQTMASRARQCALLVVETPAVMASETEEEAVAKALFAACKKMAKRPISIGDMILQNYLRASLKDRV